MTKYMKIQWEASLRSKEGNFLGKLEEESFLEKLEGGLLTPLH